MGTLDGPLHGLDCCRDGPPKSPNGIRQPGLMLTLLQALGERVPDRRRVLDEFIFLKTNHKDGEKDAGEGPGGQAHRGSGPGKSESSSRSGAGK